MRSVAFHVAVGAVALLPRLGCAQATGPAAQAAEQWYLTDRSLGCVTPQGRTIACGPSNAHQTRIFYGNGDGGPGQPDAVALVTYLPDPTGNAPGIGAALFRQEGSTYHFVRKLPGVVGSEVAPGTQVAFAAGKVTLTMVVSKPSDPSCCPSGRRVITLPLR